MGGRPLPPLLADGFPLLCAANYRLRTFAALVCNLLLSGASAGTNQVFFRSPPTPGAAALGLSLAAWQQQMDGLEAAPGRRARWPELAEGVLGSGVHPDKSTSCSGYTSPGANGDAEQQWRLWQVTTAWAEIWIMTDLGHLLQLKSLLLIRSSARVLQQHVPERSRRRRLSAASVNQPGREPEPRFPRRRHQGWRPKPRH